MMIFLPSKSEGIEGKLEANSIIVFSVSPFTWKDFSSTKIFNLSPMLFIRPIITDLARLRDFFWDSFDFLNMTKLNTIIENMKQSKVKHSRTDVLWLSRHLTVNRRKICFCNPL